MTPPIRPMTEDPFAPIQDVLAAMRSRADIPAMRGLADGLIIHDPAGWVPAGELISGAALPDLLDSAQRHWHADPPPQPH